jgi:DNA-binding SARP family transcriptional activator
MDSSTFDPPAAAHGPLPQARLRPPPLHALQRDRLLAAMHPGAGNRLTLVTGPAGSGKTTLLAQFAALHPGPVAWYRAEVDDEAPEVLLDHLAHALAVAVPGLAQGWRSVDDAVASLDANPPAGRVTVVLAIDDLHVIVGSDAGDALGQLVESLPPWLLVAATCREGPRWNLSRLRVSGALAEIGADDLRFRSWEVERLFGDVYGKPLPPGDLAHLTRGLEGWAAGLQLFHLATRDKPVNERRRAVASLPARSMLVREYLSGNVLDGLPPDQTEFLVDTSVVGRLSPHLCDELLGRHDSRRMLDELEARQVFVSRQDADDTYRYHEVFRSYLEGRLVERDGEAGARERAGRAAGLLESDGLLGDALRAYCRAADWGSVGRVLAKGGGELAGDPGDWLDALPRSLVDDDAWVMLATARRAMATGRFATALDMYDRVLRNPSTSASETTARRERTVLSCWLDPSATTPGGWAGRARQTLRRPGMQVPPGPAGSAPDTAAGEQLADGLDALVRGRVARAADLLAALAGDPDASPVAAATGHIGLVVAHALGPTAFAAPDPTELLELAEAADVPWLAAITRATVTLHSPRPWAEAASAAAALDRQGDAWGSALTRLLGALGAATAGTTTAAEADQIRDLCDDLRDLDVPALAVWAHAWRATALARAGLAGDARAAAAEAATLAARHGVPGARVWALATELQIADGDRAADIERELATVRRQSRVDVEVPAIMARRGGAGASAAGTGSTGGDSAAPVDGDGSGRAERASALTVPLDGSTGAEHRGEGEEAASPMEATSALRLSGAGAAADRTPASGCNQPATPPVHVRVLGGFSLTVGGHAVDIGEVRPRARSVLRFLAAQADRPVHSETLAAALWPDVDPAAAKRNLQVALSSLRKVLDAAPTPAGGLIRRDGATYALMLPAGSTHDLVVVADAIDRARALARLGDAPGAAATGQHALAAYAGDLLPEEGPADWVVERRRALDAEVVECAAMVAEQAVEAGQPDAAVGACQQGLAIDRYHDGLWRLLIRAQVAGGDVAAATRTQDRYRAVLDELGLSLA